MRVPAERDQQGDLLRPWRPRGAVTSTLSEGGAVAVPGYSVAHLAYVWDLSVCVW